MKVTTISANIRYSRDMGQGAWKVVELGAEATVSGQEKWQEAQSNLYQQLGQQLKALWASGNGKAHQATTEGAGPPPQPEPPPTLEHYCQEHKTDFKRYEREGKVWYSHRMKDGKWCREGVR